jgi:recombination protein RecT
MSSALDKVRGAAGIEQKQPMTVQQQIDRLTPEFAKLLGNRMDPIRFARIAYSQVKLNEKLAQDMPGLMTCIAIAATLRLEPGVLGQCYFVPYGGKNGVHNQFITGWAGHVDLVTRANKATVRTLAVREGDDFDYELGSRPRIHFKPNLDGDEDRPLLATVAIGHIVGMDDYPQIEVWGFDKLRKHLNRYNKVGDRHYAFANGPKLETSHNFEMYARKVPLLQVVKYLPKSVEWQMAAQLDYQADTGKQLLNLSTAAAVMEGDSLPELTAETVEETKQPAIELDPTTKQMNELFGYLNWNVETSAKWLKANEALSADDKIAKLKAML